MAQRRDEERAGREPVRGSDSETGRKNEPVSGQGSGPEPGRENSDRGSGPEDESGGGGRLSDEQRQRLYASLLNKLSADQLNRLSEWLKGGLTDEEAADLEKMLQGVLTETEIRQFMEILEPMRDDFPGT